MFLEVIKRDEDNLEPFTPLEDHVEDYYYSQVKKTLGLTFLEWMDLPISIKNRLTIASGRLIKNENKQLEAMKNMIEGETE